MSNFGDKFKAGMMNFMVGRYGMDQLGVATIVAFLVLTVVNFITGWMPAYVLAMALVALSIFRCYSKNYAARSAENTKFLEITEKPRAWWRLLNKKYENRDTTVYFKCKGCGQQLSIPKGKGTLRVVCPKCKTETIKKS